MSKLTIHERTFHYEPVTRTVQDLVNYYEQDQLELSPVFQRESVWRLRDRSKLIDSILNGYPLPSIFLYQRTDAGQIVYDVIDGKQRLESILKFMGKIRGGRFVAKVQLPGESQVTKLDWRGMERRGLQANLLAYRVPVHIVRGELAEVIQVFVLINSTGKALTAQEKRHARYYNSLFLKTGAQLADKLEPRLEQHQVVSRSQLSRMKHVELVCELMLSLLHGKVANKKAALEAVMRSNELTARQVKKARDLVVRAINLTFAMLPELRSTRFRQMSDFYSLVVLVGKLDAEGYMLKDKRRRRLAAGLLTAFSAGVDQVRLAMKKVRGVKPDQTLYRDYLLTVLEGTDEVTHRQQREDILRGLLENLFKHRDKDRLFSPEQRRVLWNITAERKCAECGVKLTWDDFTIDHIRPHAKGGRTRLANAALMCRKHNSAKGSGRKVRRAA